MMKSYLRSAEGKHADARRAREAAAKASKAVAAAQKRLHDAEAALTKEREREQRRAQDKARLAQSRAARDRRAEERRQRERERAQALEVAALRHQTGQLESWMRAAPWAQSPNDIDVLFVAASPEDQQALRLDKEVREIQRQVRMSEHREAVRFHWRPAMQITDLLQALNEVRPHIVHFSGHGSQDALIFEDDDGRTKALSNSDLAQLLRISSDRIRLAVFNSCNSAEQAALACEHIQAAIGMNQPVDDHAAKAFAGQFYSALGFGKPLDEAFEQAKLQSRLVTNMGSGQPRLHTAPDVDPADVYLVRPSGHDEEAA